MADITYLKLKPFKFKQLTHQHLEVKVDLIKRANNDAASNSPSQEAATPSEVEVDSEIEGRGHADTEIEKADQWTTDLQHALSSSHTAMDQDPFLTLNASLGGSLNALFLGLEAKIDRLKTEISQSVHAVDVFRHKHGLNRAPRTRHLWHTIIGFFIILGLLTYETYFNGSIFADQLQGGDAAGQAMALGIAMVNVIGSFLMGMALPLMWYQKTAWKVGGSLLFLCYLGIISYMNSLFGVFRSKLDQSADDEMSFFDDSTMNAIEVVGNPYMQLDSLNQNGQMFILIGILFAVVSLLDGLFFRDTYKGYGALGEDKKKNETKLEELRKTKQKDLEAILKNNLDAIDDIERDYRSDVNLWQSGMTLLQGFRTSYDAFIFSINSIVKHTRSQYRIINSAARFDPRPLNFDEEINITLGADYSFETSFFQLTDEWQGMEGFEEKAQSNLINIAEKRERAVKQHEELSSSFNNRLELLL